MGGAEIVHPHWHGILFGTIGLPNILEMGTDLYQRLVHWFFRLVHLAALCARSQEATRYKETREEDAINLFFFFFFLL